MAAPARPSAVGFPLPAWASTRRVTCAIGQLDRIPAWWDHRRVTCAQGCANYRVNACAPTLVPPWGGPYTVAEALYGRVGGPDPRMVSEMRRLQQRVRDLEAELVRLQEENDVLAAEVGQDLLIPVRVPALT